MQFQLRILGSGSAMPVKERRFPAQYLQIRNHRMLIDCGEGTQLEMLRHRIGFGRPDYIFISHLHIDHYLGLPGLLATMSMNQRTQPLHIFSPPGLQKVVDIHAETAGGLEPTFEIHYHELTSDTPELIVERHNLKVSQLPLDHRVPAYGFLFQEKKLPRKIRNDLPPGLRIPNRAFNVLKKGQDFTDDKGTVFRADDLTEPAPEPRSYAYMSDTRPLPALTETVRGVQLLYHEATFLHDMLEKAQETGHTTARQAGEFAVRAEVGRLLIGHASARYKSSEQLAEEARLYFPATEFAEEGKTYELAFS